jgi:hypothetical protein
LIFKGFFEARVLPHLWNGGILILTGSFSFINFLVKTWLSSAKPGQAAKPKFQL